MTDTRELQAALETQLRQNLELRAALDDCQLAAATASPLPLASWQLPLLQLALGTTNPDALQLPPASSPPGWAARLRLAWVLLGLGHADDASALQAELQAHLGKGATLDDLDLLNRVLATQAWLASSPTPPPADHNALNSAGVRMALDRIACTPDGLALCCSGWCIDPAAQLAALVLLRGPQALPIPLAALQRSPRPDLAPLLVEQGLPAPWPAGFGFTLAVPACPTEAQAVLFVLLHNGDQFCLSRAPDRDDPLSWADVLAP